jgi:hypothetical protein
MLIEAALLPKKLSSHLFIFIFVPVPLRHKVPVPVSPQHCSEVDDNWGWCAPEGSLPGVRSPVSLEEPLLAEGHLAHPAGEGLQHLLPRPQAVLQRGDLKNQSINRKLTGPGSRDEDFFKDITNYNYNVLSIHAPMVFK